MFKITLNDIGRSFGGHEQITSQADLEVWNRVQSSFSEFDFVVAEEGTYRITIDWSPAVGYRQALRDLFDGPPEGWGPRLSSFEFVHAQSCMADVEAPRMATRVGSIYALRRALYEIFLLSNLATPGSFSLHRSMLSDEIARGENARTELELEASPFYPETAWHEATNLPWLNVGFLPLDEVVDWYRKLNMSAKSVASSGIERALFTLLRLSHTRGNFDPGDIMWLASGIETLFGLPPGAGARSVLPRRIASLLELNEKEESDMRKRLGAFFDVRNAFAHGGGEVLHPLADSAENGVGKLESRFNKATNLAAGVLIGCIQEMVRRKWAGMTFEEKLIPVP